MVAHSPNSSLDESSILRRIDLAQPDIGDIRLLNGARFLSACVPNYPVASIAIYFDAGSRHEAIHEQGGLHFFEHLPAGSFRIANGGIDLAQLADKREWEIKIYISNDVLSYGFSQADFDSNDVMCLLRDCLNYGEGAYREVFEVEKGRILNEISQTQMDRRKQVLQGLNAIVMKGTGYAHPTCGTLEQVADYSFDQIMDLGKRFLSASNATIAVSGSAELISQSRTFFEEMPFPGSGGAQPPVSLAGRPDWADIPKISKLVRPLFTGVEVSAIFPELIGFDQTDEEALKLVVSQLNYALGLRLSHESGLTYNAGAWRFGYSGTGFLGASCNVDPKNLLKAVELMERTILEFPGTVTQDMLADHYRTKLTTYYRAIPAGDFGPLLQLLAIEPERPYISAVDRLRKIRSLEVEYVREIATKYLDLAKMRLVFHGREEAVSFI